MRISGVVVDHASSGCREWAEGLAREVEFIESDWSALLWAISSLRVLLDRREAPTASLAEAAFKARRFSESHREKANNFAGKYGMFMWAFLYGVRFLRAGSLYQHIGCGLAVLSVSYLGGVLWIRQRRIPEEPQGEDAGEWTRYYKSELERVRDFYHSGVGMTCWFAWTLFSIGILFAHRRGFRENLVFSVFVVLSYVSLAIFLFYQYRRLQYQIDALDALLQETR